MPVDNARDHIVRTITTIRHDDESNRSTSLDDVQHDGEVKQEES